jgi:hypothetical protein
MNCCPAGRHASDGGKEKPMRVQSKTGSNDYSPDRPGNPEEITGKFTNTSIVFIVRRL